MTSAPVTPRWKLTDTTSGRVSYVYAATGHEARQRYGEGEVRCICEPCGHWDPELGRVVSDEEIVLVEGRRAPGA